MHLTPEVLKSRVKLIDVAVIAFDLGLWSNNWSESDRDVELALKKALTTTSLQVLEAWNQMPHLPERFPPGLDEHVHARLQFSSRKQQASWIARFVVNVIRNQTRLYEHGYSAYTDVCRRLHAVMLTVLPSEAEVVRADESFAANMVRVNHFRHEEDYAIAAAATLVGTLFAAPRGRQSHARLRGSLTAVPINWTVVPIEETRVCEEGMGEPFAEYALLLSNNHVVVVNTAVGIRSVTRLPVEDNLLWIMTVGPHFYAGSTTALFEFTPTGHACLQLPTLPATNRMDKSAPSVTFPVAGSTQLVTLCLTSKQFSRSPAEADSVRSDARGSPGVFRCHVYLHGTVLVSLPRDERVVAAHIVDDNTLDVFTESNDWWRIDTATKRAVVTGLDVDAQVRDAVFMHQIDMNIEATLERLTIQ